MNILPQNSVEVLFVINPSLWYRPMYPSGILYLAAFLRQQNISCKIIDSAISNRTVPEKKRDALILQALLSYQPKLVCFSASHIELDEVVRLNGKLRQTDPSIRTIVGGPQPTYRPEDFLNNGFDFIGCGEGEQTLLEFVRESHKSVPEWRSIAGLIWKDGDRIVRNTPREVMSEEEMNKLPVPAYDMIDKRYFRINAGLIRGFLLRGAMVLTTRGCPFNCTFCGCNLIFGRKLRSKSLENVEKEVRLLKERYGVEGIWIIDDTFTVNRGHVKSIGEILKRYGIIWGCQSRVNTIDEEMIQVMKSCGCKQIDFGVESGSQRVLDEIIRKGITVEQARNAFALARKYGIRTLANFMIGLPTETMAEFEQTQLLAKRLHADVYIFSIATPLPGTKLYDMVGVPISPEEYGQLHWSGSVLTKKLNKSEIPDPEAARNRLEKQFYLQSLFRAFFSVDNLLFFLRNGSKLQRLASLGRYLKRVFGK